MQKKRFYIFILCCLSLVQITFGQNLTKEHTSFRLLSTKTNFEVGNEIILRFATSEKTAPVLYCSNNYGSTLIKANTKFTGLATYTIPSHISNKSGVVNWRVQSNNSSISGQLKIVPKSIVNSMETYLGPPSIQAGGNDFTMIVIIPTDDLDNPLKPLVPVTLKKQFLSNESTTEIKTENLIAFRRIFSPNLAGRMILSSESFGRNSKEFDVNVVPAIPTNFTITAKRHHSYADGNQITSFITSIIRDSLGNVVSDGTYVEFFIKNKKQAILKASGTTIQGVAIAQMVHPDKAAEWNVKAYVEGISESNSINISYTQVIKDFEVRFSQKNRIITVGPLTSFMKQMIPDGLEVKLTVFRDGKSIRKHVKTSREGYVKFQLKEGIYKNGKYHFTVESAGITKTIEAKRLW